MALASTEPVETEIRPGLSNSEVELLSGITKIEHKILAEVETDGIAGVMTIPTKSQYINFIKKGIVQTTIQEANAERRHWNGYYGLLTPKGTELVRLVKADDELRALAIIAEPIAPVSFTLLDLIKSMNKHPRCNALFNAVKKYGYATNGKVMLKMKDAYWLKFKPYIDTASSYYPAPDVPSIFPKYENTFPVEGILGSYTIQRWRVENEKLIVFLESTGEKVYFDLRQYSLIMREYPQAELQTQGSSTPAGFYLNGELVAVIQPYTVTDGQTKSIFTRETGQPIETSEAIQISRFVPKAVCR